MAFKEVTSLDADLVVAIGKPTKKGQPENPDQAEGYYLGKRLVENKRGSSQLHVLQTAEGNLGIWGTTDMNRKLASVTVGTMVRITANGTKSTKNGDMYMYRVESDPDNTIEVTNLAAGTGGVTEYAEDETDTEEDTTDVAEEEDAAAALAAERKAKFLAQLNRGKTAKAK